MWGEGVEIMMLVRVWLYWIVKVLFFYKMLREFGVSFLIKSVGYIKFVFSLLVFCVVL